MERFRIKEDGGYFYISPVSPSVNGKYLIRCEDLEEAQKIISEMSAGRLEEPHNNETYWTKIEEHINTKTPMYTHGYSLK